MTTHEKIARPHRSTLAFFYMVTENNWAATLCVVKKTMGLEDDVLWQAQQLTDTQEVKLLPEYT